LTIFLLSLAGIPPLAGFFGKFLVFGAAIQSKYYILAIAGVVNSILALYYYVKVVKFMYLYEPRAMAARPGPSGFLSMEDGAVKLALIIAFAGILIIGLFPVPFLNWISLSLL
jgi:NADH-quinone oxidoreductase subunit N